MPKFHVNPATGAVGQCKATIIECPFGLSESQHFSNEQEARNAYENIMSKATFKSVKSSRKRLITPPISSYIDTELLKNMIDSGYILQSRHPDDDTLSVLCYSKYAQYEGKWNDATKKARGLIVQSSSDNFDDGVIVQRPWEKFFTLSQIESGWSLGDEENSASASDVMSLIDFDAPAEVTDKMDGSMGILYRSPKGTPAFATKGSFKSEQANDYTKLMNRDEKFLTSANELLDSHPDTTFIFEMVGGGKNQIVLSYDKDDIAMIGAVKKSNGLYLSTGQFNDKWADKGLSVAENMPARNLREAVSLPNRENSEGVVVRIMSDDQSKQMQIKIKQEDYLKLHKLRTAFSKDDARKVMRETPATVADFLTVAKTKDVSHFPKISATINEKIDAGTQSERFQNQRRSFYEEAIIGRANKIAEAKDIIDSLPQSDFVGDQRDVKKKFALKAKELGADKRILFSFFNARLNGQDISSIDAKSEMWKAAQDV